MNERGLTWLSWCVPIALGLTTLVTQAAVITGPATMVAEMGLWQSQQTAHARISPWREVSMVAPFAVRVAEVKADVGDIVRNEQVLARLEAPDLVALLKGVQITLEEVALATHRADALEQSLREKAVTRSTKLEADMALEAVRSRLSEAWKPLDNALLALGQRIDHTTIIQLLAKQTVEAAASRLGVVQAPFEGLLVDRQIALEQTVARGAQLFRVEDLTRVYVEVGVPRIQLPAWREGTAVALDANGAIPLTLVSEEPRLDTATGLWLLRFVAENPDRQLQDGAWLKVGLSGPAQPVVWVPKPAVVARDGETYCIRKQGNKFESVRVSVGSETKERIPVLSGLNVGDQVVTEGAYELLYRDIKDLMKFVD